MNYLITGGTGLIGQQLVSTLLLENNRVVILTRDKDTPINNLNNVDHLTLIDKLNKEEIEHSDVIINLAGEPIADGRWSTTKKHKICQSRWQLTEEIANLIKNADKKPQLFISGSAIGIYGRQNANVITEDFSKHHAEFTHTVCKKWEDIALDACSEQTRVALLRTGIVISDKGGALEKMLLPFKLGVGGKIANGEQMMSWIHLDDMVKAILHIVNTDTLQGAINLTSPKAVSNNKFSQQLAKTLNRPCLFTTPAPMLKLIFGEMADLLLFGQNVYPQKLLQSGYEFSYPQLDCALSNLLNS